MSNRPKTTIGVSLRDGLDALFQERKIPCHMAGNPPCPAFVFDESAEPGIGDAFYRAAFRHGVSLCSIVYVNYSHSPNDIAETLEQLEKAVGDLRR